MPIGVGGTPLCVGESVSQREGNPLGPSPPHKKSTEAGQGCQCTKADHSIQRMKTGLGLDSTTPNGGSIEKDGEDGNLDHALHN